MFAFICVHAAREEESKKELVKPPLQSNYVEEQPGNWQVGFGSIHTAADPDIGWRKGVYVLVENGIMDTVQFGQEAYVYLKNPPWNFLLKTGLIGFRIGRLGFSKKRF